MPDATVTPAGVRIVKLLVGRPPATVTELIRSAGVTRTAVTAQLDDLMANGFVERTIQHLPGRGRPRHLYSATTAALLLLFASQQSLVVPAIWRAIADVGGPELTRKIRKRVTHRLVDHFRSRVTGGTPAERLRQVSALLAEEGHLVEVAEDAGGALVMRKRSCPFIGMFEETRTVCGVDLDVISAIVKAPVRQTASRHDGAPCCTFELASANGK